MAGHFAEHGRDLVQDVALGLHNAHEAHDIAGVVQRHGEVVAAGVQLEATAHHDVAQGHVAAFARHLIFVGDDAVGNDGQGLVRMAAFAHDDLLDAEFLGGLHVLQGDTGGLGVVVEHAVVHRVIAHGLAGQGPGQTGFLEDQGEGGDVFGPGHDFAGIVQQQDVGALHVKGRMDAHAGDFRVVLVDELHVFLHHFGGHAGGGTHHHLVDGALFVQFAGIEAQFLAEELADFAGDQTVVHADGAGLGAATAQVAAVGQFAQTRHGLPVQAHVAVTPFGQRFLFDILLVDAAEDFGPEVGPVHFILAGHLVQVAGVGAGIALGAVIHARFQHGQEGPVVFLGKQLAHAVDELVDQLFLFLLVGRLGDIEHAHFVKDAGGLFLLLLGEGAPGHGLQIQPGNFGQVFGINVHHLPFGSGDICQLQRIFHINRSIKRIALIRRAAPTDARASP